MVRYKRIFRIEKYDLPTDDLTTDLAKILAEEKLIDLEKIVINGKTIETTNDNSSNNYSCIAEKTEKCPRIFSDITQWNDLFEIGIYIGTQENAERIFRKLEPYFKTKVLSINPKEFFSIYKN